MQQRGMNIYDCFSLTSNSVCGLLYSLTFLLRACGKKALLVESQFKGVIVLTGLMFVTWSISK